MEKVLELQKEVNRWLKVKWQHADYNRELPTVSDTIAEMKALLSNWESLHGHEFISAVNQTRESLGHPKTYASVSVQTLWGFTFVPATENTPPRLLWVCGKGTDHERTIMSFDCVIKHCELEDDVGNGVKSISASSEDLAEDAAIMGIALRAEALESSVDGYDINVRWLSAPVDFRRKHTICPKCQGELETYHSDSRVCLECHRCGWESHKNYDYESDFAEEKAFSKECRFLAKKEKYQADADSALKTTEASIKAAVSVYKKRPKGCYKIDTNYRNAFIRMCEEAIKEFNSED